MVVFVKPDQPCDYSVEHTDGSIIPYTYSESVSVAKSPKYEEHTYGQRCKYEQQQRYKESVQCVPKMIPKSYSTTVWCDDGHKHHKSEIFMTPSMKGRRFSSTVYVFPKYPTISCVSTLLFHMEGTRKWYKSALELEAKDYATMKIFYRT